MSSLTRDISAGASIDMFLSPRAVTLGHRSAGKLQAKHQFIIIMVVHQSSKQTTQHLHAQFLNKNPENDFSYSPIQMVPGIRVDNFVIFSLGCRVGPHSNSQFPWCTGSSASWTRHSTASSHVSSAIHHVSRPLKNGYSRSCSESSRPVLFSTAWVCPCRRVDYWCSFCIT